MHGDMISMAIRFYRQRPVIGVLMVLVGLALAVGLVTIGADSPILAVVFMVVMGLVFGAAIAAAQPRDR